MARAAKSPAKGRSPTPTRSPARASPAKSPAKRAPTPSRPIITAPERGAKSEKPAGNQGHLSSWQDTKNGKCTFNGEYEFGGTIGAVGIMFGLPLLTLALFVGCGADFCVKGLNDLSPSNAQALPARLLGALRDYDALWSWEAIYVVFGWTALHFAFYLGLPGEVARGVVLRDGTRLRYHLNGHLAFWLCLSAAALGVPAIDLATGAMGAPAALPLAWLYDHYVELMTASLLLSVLVSIWCYASSFARGTMLAAGGCSGNPVYDFFIGRPLNPRIGQLDLKCACELRPGLIGWVFLNLGCAAKQFAEKGSLSGSMICVNAFQALYVWDSLHYEQAILTTMDITTDGFGYMLAFGDLTWVPFTYSLQARVLVSHDPGLSVASLLGIALLNAAGYLIFRGANSQKDAFRRNPADPAVAHLETLPTKRGTNLLVSGWWGMARRLPLLRTVFVVARRLSVLASVLRSATGDGRRALLSGAQDQLHRRLAHGSLVVPHVRRAIRGPLLLRDLLRGAPRAPRRPRRPHVRRKIRRRLGKVQGQGRRRLHPRRVLELVGQRGGQGGRGGGGARSGERSDLGVGCGGVVQSGGFVSMSPPLESPRRRCQTRVRGWGARPRAPPLSLRELPASPRAACGE